MYLPKINIFELLNLFLCFFLSKKKKKEKKEMDHFWDQNLFIKSLWIFPVDNHKKVGKNNYFCKKCKI